MQANLVTVITKAQGPRHSCNVSQLRRARHLRTGALPLKIIQFFRLVTGRGGCVRE